MKIKTNKINVILILVNVIIFLYLLKLNVDKTFLLAISCWQYVFIYSFINLKKRTILFFFLISFFVFLLGGHLVYEMYGLELQYYFGDEYYQHSNMCIAISMFGLFIGFFINEHVKIKKRRKQELTEMNISTDKILIRKISLLLFYLTYIFWIYNQFNVIMFVTNNSYSAYFVEYESNAPFIIRALAAMTPYFFYLFLATMPSKKECRIPITLYVLNACMSIFSGKRGDFVFSIIFITLYFVARHFTDHGKEIWIKRRYIYIGLISVPALFIILYMYNFIRLGLEVPDQSILDMFLNFFQQQGFSSSIMRLEMYYRERLLNNPYSFSGIEKFMHTNIILKSIFNIDSNVSYTSQNIYRALESNSLSSALSYFALGKQYLLGRGVGSCYIAELYHDFGHFGVILGNFIYGYVMCGINRKWNDYKSYNIWLVGIGFAMVESFIKAPRWNFDVIISYFLDMGMWTAFLSVFLFALIMKHWSIRRLNK